MENIKVAKERTSAPFIERYNTNIRRFKMADSEGARAFIDTNNFETECSKLYYNHNLEMLCSGKHKEIDSCDDNGRIYHIGTKLPHLLRQFTNINFIIDCKNSHPLLLNYLLLGYYINKSDISIYKIHFHKSKLYFKISFFINNNFSNNSLYYFRNNLCNYLKDNDVEDSVIAKLRKVPLDVWQYMYDTSHGLLWDSITEMFEDVSRDEVKELCFRKVFYSYAKNVSAGNEYAKAFQRLYPNVMKVIRYCKQTFHKECMEQGKTKLKKYINRKDGRKVASSTVIRGAVQLPHKLMQLESAIFQEILTRLFRKRDLHCFGIHDAVAVLNDKYPAEFVHSVMMDVYKEFGLSPTLDIKYNNFKE